MIQEKDILVDNLLLGKQQNKRKVKYNISNYIQSGSSSFSRKKSKQDKFTMDPGS